MSGSVIVPLAQERRSQPQQIAELQERVSKLTQQFALDSQTIHRQLIEHEAALVHFREALDAQHALLTSAITHSDTVEQELREQLASLKAQQPPRDLIGRVSWLIFGGRKDWRG